MTTRKIILVAHNIRSAHNVGSLLRTADGLGVDKLYLCGHSPYPEAPADKRLPHVRLRATRQIHKTALGAENNVDWEHVSGFFGLLKRLKKQGFLIAALEQTPQSQSLRSYRTNQDIVLVVGSELKGLDSELLKPADVVLEIPMLGEKESFNIAVAAAIALYHLRYMA